MVWIGKPVMHLAAVWGEPNLQGAGLVMLALAGTEYPWHPESRRWSIGSDAQGALISVYDCVAQPMAARETTRKDE